MGGIPASSISQKADMVILDRTFSSFNAMAYWKYHGMLADVLFKFYFCGYEIQNDSNLIQAPQALEEQKEDYQILSEVNKSNATLQVKEPDETGRKSCYKVLLVAKNDDTVHL